MIYSESEECCVRKQFILLILLFLFFTCFGYADHIYLKSGKTIEAEVISETEDKVTMRLPMGQQNDIVYTLQKSDIAEIEEAPVSYDFLTEEAIKTKVEIVEENNFSIENIIKKVLSIFTKEKELKNNKDINLSGAGKRIKAYITSSGVVGFITNFILTLIAISIFNIFRKDTSVIVAAMDKLTGPGLLIRWLFFTAGILLVQFQRFGSFDFIVSGIVSICLLAAICYETLGFIVLLFFRKQYKAFLSGGNSLNVMVFKIPIAFEFTLFAYLLFMDIFIILL